MSASPDLRVIPKAAKSSSAIRSRHQKIANCKWQIPIGYRLSAISSEPDLLALSARISIETNPPRQKPCGTYRLSCAKQKKTKQIGKGSVFVSLQPPCSNPTN